MPQSLTNYQSVITAFLKPSAVQLVQQSAITAFLKPSAAQLVQQSAITAFLKPSAAQLVLQSAITAFLKSTTHQSESTAHQSESTAHQSTAHQSESTAHQSESTAHQSSTSNKIKWHTEYTDGNRMRVAWRIADESGKINKKQRMYVRRCIEETIKKMEKDNVSLEEVIYFIEYSRKNQKSNNPPIKK